MDRPDTLIRNCFWRLCISCAVLLMLVGYSASSSAQLSDTQNVYTIIGDVQLPATYRWDAGQRVSLQMVLERARAAGQSGTAVIRKASEPERAIPVSVWNANARGTLLTPRDTIIWRCVSGANLKSGNVVLLTDQGPLLHSIQATGVNLSTVLELAEFSTNQQVLVHRSLWEAQRSFPLAARDLVHHGDVLDLRTRVASAVNAGQSVVGSDLNDSFRTISSPSSMPQVMTSPWQQTDVPTVPQSSLLIPKETFNGPSEDSPSIPLEAAAAPLQIPSSSSAIADAELREPANDGSAESISSTIASLDDLANEVMEPVSSPQKTETHAFLNGIFLFGLVLAIGLITIGIVRTRQEQRLYRQMRVGTEPTPRAESSSNEVISCASSLDTLTASVDRPSPESFTQLPVFSAEPGIKKPGGGSFDEVENEVCESANDAELEECPVLSVGLDGVEPTDEFELEIDYPNRADADHKEESFNVETWLSEDSDTDSVSSETQDKTMSNPIPPALVKLSPEEDAEGPILKLPDVESVREKLSSSQIGVSEIQAVDPVSEETILDEESGSPAVISLGEIDRAESCLDDAQEALPDSTISLDAPQPLQNQDHDMAHPSMTKAEADYLEDLIQNRLPMELSDAQLPLQVSLFGKPEGPRRLRIDAAHSTIAPPHMARTAGRAMRREPQMAAPQKTAGHEELIRPNEVAKEPIETRSTVMNPTSRESVGSSESDVQRSTSSEAQNSANGLDKALNFLEEQSKS